MSSPMEQRQPHPMKRRLRRAYDRAWRFALVPLAPAVKRIVYDQPHFHGGRDSRARIHPTVRLANTLINCASGTVTIGRGTIFGHNCMVITGRHMFEEGQRRALSGAGREVPRGGYDIVIGEGCWIASGAIISGGVTIGDNVIVAAGAVVTSNVPSGVMVGGVPARVLRHLDSDTSARATAPPA